MKGLKYISLFLIYPVALIILGFVGGVTCVKFFYPGTFQTVEQKSEEQAVPGPNLVNTDLDAIRETDDWQVITGTPEKNVGVYQAGYLAEQEAVSPSLSVQESHEKQEVSALTQKLNAGTSYVLEETDLRNDTVVETTWKLPAKYIGMNREQFLEAMDLYEASPPLAELERGFVSLEVKSFSPQKVVVQMNYDYIQPGSSFYLKVEDNFVVVYLEDKTTIYMDTDILLKDLPEDLQQEIIQVMFVPDEESLYDFLENYSS
ncbi:MAG: hypothetical protein IKV27_05605 [Lachnospiraceae bacterium]|nr:hypothetical protein [Lachnospiraceae bacterium]